MPRLTGFQIAQIQALLKNLKNNNSNYRIITKINQKFLSKNMAQEIRNLHSNIL